MKRYCGIEKISLYIDGKLYGEEKAGFEKHLGNSAPDREEYEDMLDAVHLCGSLSEVEVPVDFKAGLHEKLMQLKKPGIRMDNPVLFQRRYIKLIAGAAAALLIVFAMKGIVYDSFLKLPKQDNLNGSGSAQSMRAAAQADNDIKSKVDSDIKSNADKDKSTETGGAGSVNEAESQKNAPPGKGADNADMGIMSETANLPVKKSITIAIIDKEPQLQAERIKNYTDEKGWKYSIQNQKLKSLSQNEQPQSQIQSQLRSEQFDIRIPGEKYTEFENWLKTNFPGIQFGEVKSEDISVEIAKLDAELSEINKEIKEKQENESTSNPELLDALYKDQKRITAEINSLQEESKTILITFTIATGN